MFDSPYRLAAATLLLLFALPLAGCSFTGAPAAGEPVAGAPAAGAPAAADEPPAKEQPAGGETAESAETRYQNFIRWSTASEVDNFGYDVYRGGSEEGPFERQTEKPMLGAGTTDEPSHYEFADDGIDPYATYWYYVESISMTGERERFSPIVRKKPKLERQPSESEGDGEEPADDPEGRR